MRNFIYGMFCATIIAGIAAMFAHMLDCFRLVEFKDEDY